MRLPGALARRFWPSAIFFPCRPVLSRPPITAHLDATHGGRLSARRRAPGRPISIALCHHALRQSRSRIVVVCPGRLLSMALLKLGLSLAKEAVFGYGKGHPSMRSFCVSP